MKKIYLTIVVISLSISQLLSQNQNNAYCEVLNHDRIGYRHDVHPMILENEQQRENGWSVQTAYSGCPNTCAGGTGFDCCMDMPCEDYKIPVVFTLLVDDNCDGQLLGVGNLNAFIDKVNGFYDCLGVPFEFFKCPNWDQTGENVLVDGSTRLLCDNDLSVFYLNSCADGLDPCCCNGDPACIADCNLQPDPFGDFINDFSEATDFNIPNVMNIYIPINYNGLTALNFSSEGGVAFFPDDGLYSYGTAFGVNGLTNLDEDCNGNSGTTVSIHEFGHFFGLLHTHGAVNNAQVNANDPNGNFWAECPDGSECCELGDYICDTPPDPNVRTSDVQNSNGNDISNCVINNGCNYDLSGCFSTCGVPYPADFTNNNIMSYGTCDYSLTPCQIAKMVDGLLCARNQLSCCEEGLIDSTQPDAYITTSTYTICVGDPAPTFVIDNPGGDVDNVALNENCIGWYATQSNTTDFDVLGTGLTFTPDLDTSVEGTYSFYFDDDLTKYSLVSCLNQIRKEVQITIEDCGGGTCPETQPINFPLPPPFCGNDTMAIEQFINSWKSVVEATDGTGVLVTQPEVPTLTSFVYSSNPNYTVNDFPSSNWDAEPDYIHSGSCEDEFPEVYCYVICDLTGNGETSDDPVTLVESYFLFLVAPPQEPTIILNDDVCTYSIQLVCPDHISDPATIPSAIPGTDPNPISITVNSFFCEETYVVDPPACEGNVCFEIIDYNVIAGECDLTGVEIQLLDEAGAVLDSQPINSNGSSGSFGTYFCGVYYLQLVNVPVCFTQNGASIGPELVNLDGQGITYIAFAPFPLIPTLSQWGLIIMALILMIFGALKIINRRQQFGLGMRRK